MIKFSSNKMKLSDIKVLFNGKIVKSTILRDSDIFLKILTKLDYTTVPNIAAIHKLELLFGNRLLEWKITKVEVSKFRNTSYDLLTFY